MDRIAFFECRSFSPAEPMPLPRPHCTHSPTGAETPVGNPTSFGLARSLILGLVLQESIPNELSELQP